MHLFLVRFDLTSSFVSMVTNRLVMLRLNDFSPFVVTHIDRFFYYHGHGSAVVLTNLGSSLGMTVKIFKSSETSLVLAGLSGH